jgi:hypothetical protein
MSRIPTFGVISKMDASKFSTFSSVRVLAITLCFRATRGF